MKEFHISDILSATTGRLVSNRHMDGVYDIYNFLTGDSLYTHQLPRAFRECGPWLAAQFPKLMEADAEIAHDLAVMDRALELRGDVPVDAIIAAFVLTVRTRLDLPEMIAVYELGADMHARIDPVEEAVAMVGADRVIVVGDPEK